MVALSLLIAIVLVYFISLNDDGFAYQRSAEGVVLYVQVKSHTFLPNNIINNLFIVYHLLYFIFLSYAHTQLPHRIHHSLNIPLLRHASALYSVLTLFLCVA